MTWTDAISNRGTVRLLFTDSAPVRLATAILDRMAERRRKAAARRTIAGLTPEQLKDVGLDGLACQVSAEHAFVIAALMLDR